MQEKYLVRTNNHVRESYIVDQALQIQNMMLAVELFGQSSFLRRPNTDGLNITCREGLNRTEPWKC